MIKLNISSILYSNKNLDLEYKLHNFCKMHGINIVTATDFVEMTIKSVEVKPQIVFCDCKTIKVSSYNLNTFIEKMEFRHTRILFIGDAEDKKQLSSFMGKNMIAITYEELPKVINNIIADIMTEKVINVERTNTYDNLNVEICKLLANLGFSAKFSGYAYLCNCIKNVVIHNGMIHSLSAEQYSYTAFQFKTTAINVERNIRNAISYAWKNFGSNWHEILYSKALQLGKKPTNREFIFMCSTIIISKTKIQMQVGI